jgi:hypothetical protein
LGLSTAQLVFHLTPGGETGGQMVVVAQDTPTRVSCLVPGENLNLRLSGYETYFDRLVRNSPVEPEPPNRLFSWSFTGSDQCDQVRDGCHENQNPWEFRGIEVRQIPESLP